MPAAPLPQADSPVARTGLAQDQLKAASFICYGDFDGDGINDIAVVMEDVNKRHSRLLITATDPVNRQQYVAFTSNYPEKVKITAFKKGAKISMDGGLPERAHLDGIMLEGEDVKLAIVYDRQQQLYRTWYQEIALN
jgi:hypothetical protein